MNEEKTAHKYLYVICFSDNQYNSTAAQKLHYNFMGFISMLEICLHVHVKPPYITIIITTVHKWINIDLKYIYIHVQIWHIHKEFEDLKQNKIKTKIISYRFNSCKLKKKSWILIKNGVLTEWTLKTFTVKRLNSSFSKQINPGNMT